MVANVTFIGRPQHRLHFGVHEAVENGDEDTLKNLSKIKNWFNCLLKSLSDLWRLKEGIDDHVGVLQLPIVVGVDGKEEVRDAWKIKIKNVNLFKNQKLCVTQKRKQQSSGLDRLANLRQLNGDRQAKLGEQHANDVHQEDAVDLDKKTKKFKIKKLTKS